MKKKNSKGAAKLRKIVTLAKQIRTKSPGKKWTSCIKEASKKI